MYMVSSRTFCWLVGVEVSWSQHHWPSGSNWSGVFVLVGSIQLTSPTWQGFQYLQDSSEDISENIISSPGGGTKGLWLCLMAKLLFCLLNCFPLLLHLLISLIKVICWLFFFFFFTDKRQAEDMWVEGLFWKAHRILLSYILDFSLHVSRENTWIPPFLPPPRYYEARGTNCIH